MLHTKSQINPATVTLVVTAAIMLIITGVVFFSSLKTLTQLKDVADDTTTNLGRNESLSPFVSARKNGTGIYLLNPRVESVTVFNGSKVIKQGAAGRENYTVNATDGIIIFYNYSAAEGTGGANANDTFNDAATLDVNVTYSYRIGSSARNVTIKNQQSLYEFSAWQPTWGMILGAAVILMLIMSVAIFLFRKMG